MANLFAFPGIASLLILALYLVNRLYRSKHALPLPPGPKGLLILGNINDLPNTDIKPEWLHWQSHKDAYGPISSMTALGQTFVIINSPDLALMLLRDRATIYSGRPSQHFVHVMVGWGNTMGMMHAGPVWKQHRKNTAKIASSTSTMSVFDRVQEEEAAHFLLNILNEPDQLFQHIRREAAAVVARVMYGYIPESHRDDPLIELVGKVMGDLGTAATPGRYKVDILPFLQYVPAWFPGTGWKKTARDMAALLSLNIELPLAFVRAQMLEKKHRISYLSKALDDSTSEEEVQKVHKYTALSLYAGGADTTVSSIMTFFLAMTLHPEVQKAAQEEIDRVIGSDRLPTSADKDNLPYIQAVVKEVHRWHPVAPMGVPHMCTKEDAIEGYRIPEGAMIIVNTWGFCRDPAVYPEPECFKPERHLSASPPPDPRIYTFGYGRRVCPGRWVADNALFITMAQVLSMFRISPHESGLPAVAFEPGLVSHAKPFKCNIEPRSEKHRELILQSELEYPWLQSDSAELEAVGKKMGIDVWKIGKP